MIRNLLTGSFVGCVLAGATAFAGPQFVNSLATPGGASDLSGLPGPNGSRLSFGSDLFYDAHRDVYYGLADRGPGGGVISYETRVQQFKLNVDATTGAISHFQLKKTILFKTADGSASFNGLNPLLLNGDSSVLGLSFDPEGFVVGSNGNYYVADEYGPSLYEFTPVDVGGGTIEARFVRAFQTPANLIPKTSGGTVDYVAGRPTITTGRQDNRGFEGIAISPDGKTLTAVMQDPLVNEGASNDGRRSQNLRVVTFDTQTGESTGQFAYQLESIADLNTGLSNPFSATNQGRSIGLSAIVALNDSQFLVLERDNRGLGVDNPYPGFDATLTDVAHKQLYLVDLTGATDISGISLAGSNSLPSGVTPVMKSSFFDILGALESSQLIVPEKLEGLAIGPRLNNGDYSLILVTDNDFSVTQDTSSLTQYDVYTNFVDAADRAVPFGGTGPDGMSLIPTWTYALRAELDGYIRPTAVPEPSSVLLLAAGLGLIGVRRYRSRSR